MQTAPENGRRLSHVLWSIFSLQTFPHVQHEIFAKNTELGCNYGSSMLQDVQASVTHVLAEAG
jgi:hypothetical protein